MTTQPTPPTVALLPKETQPFIALCFTTRATLPTLHQHAHSVAEQLCREAARLNLDLTGPIQWIYTGVNGDETNEFQLEIALPIRQPRAEPDGFLYRVFPEFRCVSYTYTGPWSDFGRVYDTLFCQFYHEGYQNDGRIREIYTVIDAKNQENCVTEMQIGIA